MTFNYLLSDLVLPPTSLLLLALFGLALRTRSPRACAWLIGGSLGALLVLSLPVVAYALARSLEPPPATAEAVKQAQAIVILGGGRNLGAPDWNGETVNSFTLQRLRYGAHLARSTGLPLYVTGGKPSGGVLAEGTLMNGVLTEYGLAARWIDDAADTTRDNALIAARDLKPAGIERVVLVTTAIHMPRSARAFRAAGLTVIPAPTHYAGQRRFGAYQLVPSVTGLRVSHLALREWVSQAYYALRGS